MYNANSSEFIESRISMDMKTLVSVILQEIQNVKAIFLVGGFGRNEGSVLCYEDKYQPLNDYDLVVIGDKWQDGLQQDLLRKKLAELCKIRQVDIVLIQPQKLTKLSHTMYNYDLKYASKVIYGSQDLLCEIPSWQSRDMPLKEAIAPLFLFLSSILQAYPSDKKHNKEDIFWSYQQLTKSILGWSSAMLIFEGLYDPSYIKRKNDFQETFSHEGDLCELVKIATKFRMNPVLNICNKKELSDFWLVAREAHLRVLKKLVCRYYKADNLTWDKIVVRHQSSFINIIKTIYSILFNQHHYRDCLNTDIAKLYLCLGLNHGGKEFIDKSKKYYQKLVMNREELSLIDRDEDYLNLLLKSDINAQIFYARGNQIFYD
jgi:hypothetical protein|tara:strand:+ start:126 stop:1247 length:1122 start_codon:yes stop_codon:yes gene_type:complete